MSLIIESSVGPASEPQPRNARPLRLGFAGVGWIGRHRMTALLQGGHTVATALCDIAPEALEIACREADGAESLASFDALIERDLDGIVIATPSALHAGQTEAALERGIPVFCQKPLARSAAETQAVLAAAARADRLLGVDLSYRYTLGMQAVRDLIQRGELGVVYAADLVFHNGFGPDKAWFYDPELSGGGCLMDLGVHLVDLALWTLGFPRVAEVRGALYASGTLLEPGAPSVEDYATAELRLATDTTVRVAVSWNSFVGTDAVIAAEFHGTRGGASFRNVNGSFYDFEALHFTGTQSRTLASPPDDWGGRAALAWADRLRLDPSYDPEIEHVLATAAVLDAVYGR